MGASDPKAVVAARGLPSTEKEQGPRSEERGPALLTEGRGQGGPPAATFLPWVAT